MSDVTVARRYALALHQEADDQGVAGQIEADVDLVRESLSASRELVRFFESPVISREKKQAVARRLFGERVSPLMMRFLLLLIDKGREALVPAAMDAFRVLRDEQLGITEVQARSALELSAEEREQLKEALGRLTGKSVRLRLETDPALLGGLVVRVGDTVYDGSVRHRLGRLREALREGSSYLSN